MDFSVTDPVSLPATPGGDFIGSVVSVGKGVTAWKEGDRVAALVRTGGNARYMILSQDSLVAVPRSVESCEAVAMVSTYMTAYQSKSFAGKAVLVTGGIGPVGQALIQLSFRAGADIVFCTAPDNRHRYVKSVLGAKPLPMEPSKWLPLLEGKIDVVFDSACQDGFDSPQKALNSNGKLICLGMYSLLQQETMGAFGAPMSAFWAKTKAQYLMGNTQFYEVWESFQSDPKKFKVRRNGVAVHTQTVCGKHTHVLNTHLTHKNCLSLSLNPHHHSPAV
jgi:NADPH:quinone reductase-like Zn-dependent oxidoreductase